MVRTTIPVEESKEEEEKSYLLLQFAEVGSAMIIHRVFENLTPEQMILASEVLGIVGKNTFISMENERLAREQQMGIQVPGEGSIEIAKK